MKLSRPNGNRLEPAGAGAPVPVLPEQTAAKAIAALVLSVLGAIGITVTDGTGQLIVAAVNVAIIVYGVWRVRNRPKGRRVAGPGEEPGRMVA